MEAIFEALQARAERSRDGAAQPRIGIVASYDHHTATARVLLQPEGVLIALEGRKPGPSGPG